MTIVTTLEVSMMKANTSRIITRTPNHTTTERRTPWLIVDSSSLWLDKSSCFRLNNFVFLFI